MNKKDSEKALGELMRANNYFTHKWRDRGFISCPQCHKPVMVCPNCKGSLLLPKAQSYPDFLVAKSYAFVECKQGEESWPITDVSDTQEVVMNACEWSWIFLLMGTGIAPKGKASYLIPWEKFKEIRSNLLTLGIKSVRYQASEKSKVPLASAVFMGYELQYQRGQGWIIPIQHPWWANDLEP